MGKPFKIILSIIAAMFFLVAITLITLPFFIDPNNFKPEIAAAVKENTGRDLTLTGELKLSIFPWLGISTGQMVLGNAVGFQERPFATLEESTIKVKLLPLLIQKIEISRIVVKGLVLNLTKNSQGVNNWSDLKSATIKTTSPVINNAVKPDASHALTGLTIGGIAVENALINWDDQRSEKHLLIKDVNLNSDQFDYDQPVAIDLSLVILNQETKLTQSVKLTTALTVNEKLDTLVLSHSDLQTILEGESIPGKFLTATLNVAATALDLAKQTVNVSGLVLKSKDVTLTAEIAGSSLDDKPSFQGPVSIAAFNPSEVLKQLGIAIPVMQDPNALTKSAATFTLLATENSVDLQNLLMTLDETQIKGSTHVTDFAQPVITFNLTADTCDVDRYLPPVTDKSSRPVTSPAVALASGASALPVETLKKLNIDGQLSLGKLKINGLVMQDIQLNLDAKNSLINTEQSAKTFYQGSYNGSLAIDMRNQTPTLTLNEKITRVQIEPLLKDFKGEAKMSGIIDASAQLQGQGNNTHELKSSLNGSFGFLFKDSVVKGFNLQKIIDDAKALIKEPAVTVNNKNDQTLFSNITGTATLNKGLLQNNDLVASSAKMHINGKGNADLNTEKLDYKLNTRLIKTGATATEPEQLHDTPINIAIAGTFSKPTYTLDVAALLTDENKAKIEKFIDKNQEKIDNIADKIDKKLGPGVGDLLKGLFKKH
ncbi:AsmA family protein [Methylobacter psychrophilus]|uniref:AsmA family protein n=1 Tax=Methylobacter psychrophilus TaxID=96941 RepID=UPI0021D4ECA8|nr:AsmA family protein [Methylobacter psychrophilus]